nr:Ycf40 [Ochrosphaera neapolitana]
MSTHNLLTYLGFNLEVVLVTCNGLLLQKEALSKRLIQPNDVLEIITLAGGG